MSATVLNPPVEVETIYPKPSLIHAPREIVSIARAAADAARTRASKGINLVQTVKDFGDPQCHQLMRLEFEMQIM